MARLNSTYYPVIHSVQNWLQNAACFYPHDLTLGISPTFMKKENLSSLLFCFCIFFASFLYIFFSFASFFSSFFQLFVDQSLHQLAPAHVTHMEILIILLNLIFQICLLSIFFGHFIEEFGSVIAFPVQVWSWKLCQF